MSPSPSQPPTGPAWGPAELYRRLLAGEEPAVLDVRHEDEWAAWRLAGRGELPGFNLPYYEMVAAAAGDDLVAEFAAFLAGGPAARLPSDRPLLAVCARGDTSAYVAAALRRLGRPAVNLAGGMAAWADHYETAAVVEADDVAVYQVTRPARGCVSYLLASAGRALVVDPLRHIEVYLDLAARLGARIERVLDTHGHADHVSGGPALAAAAGAPYHLHPYDAIHPIDGLPGNLAYEYLRDGDVVAVGAARLALRHVPGHTLGQVVGRLERPGDCRPRRLLLAADTVSIGSVSRPDLGGRGEAWGRLHHRSLAGLLALPADTVVLPGHFASLAEADAAGRFAAPLGELAERNRDLARVRAGEAQFVAHLLASLPRFPSEYVEIKRANAGLTALDAETAARLEVGPNLCALARREGPAVRPG